MDTKKRRRNRKLWIIEVLLTLAFIVLLIVIISRVCSAARTAGEEKAAAELHRMMENTNYRINEEEIPSVQPEIAELMEQNPDAVGILHFGDNHTLYVCKTTDNNYYMAHRFDKSEDPAGMIYMDYRNSLLPRSNNLILYGHNMRDGSRFGTLKRYGKAKYIEKYPVFQLADQYETIKYMPFAVYQTTVLPDHPEYYVFDQTDFDDEIAFDRYVNDAKVRSVVDIPVEVQYGDKLLTLATCCSDIERGRLIIVCREVKPGEKIQWAD